MSRALTHKSRLKSGASVACTANTTTAVSDVWSVSGDDSYALAALVTHGSTTVAAAITAKLQECMTPDGTFTDVAGGGSTASITGASGTALLRFETVESSTYPLLPYVRVVVVCGAGDSTTISSVLATFRG